MKIRLCCKDYFSSSQVYHFWKRTKLKPKEVIRQSLEILAVLRTAKRATKPKIEHFENNVSVIYNYYCRDFVFIFYWFVGCIFF